MHGVTRARGGDGPGHEHQDGKTQPEAVAAVLVHHDTDLYDLRIPDHGKSSVIDTTRSHLFWIPGSAGGARWAKAASLKYGTHLRTPHGSDTVTVTGGWTPAVTAGWMWNLTIPGNNDHDFYTDTLVGSVLVHNCTNPFCGANMSDEESLAYHYAKHGDGATLEQYAHDAQTFADNPTGDQVTEVALKDGTTGTRYRTPGGPGGIVDQAGRLITFWYK
jgi:hypothetical protein